jgi:hypothetical protein
MLQWDGVVMEMMMMMMILMKSGAMVMMMAMISPSPGRNFPGRFLPAGELFSLWCSPPRRVS